MRPDDFLANHADPRPWALDDGEFDVGGETSGPGGITPDLLFLGQGQHALEIATARAGGRPQAASVRSVWRRRQRNRPSPLVLVVAYPHDGGFRASVCGPVGDEPPVVSGLELGQVERLCSAALDEPNRHTAVRLLTAALPEVESELPGVHNSGMFASHELRAGVPLRPDWTSACEQGREVLRLRGRDLVEGLGFEIEEHTVTASVLRIAGAKRAIAVFLQEHEGFEAAADRFQATSPVTHALAVADREGLPWVVLTRANQIRVYSSKPDLGVGRKGRAETFVELNLSLLPEQHAGYLPLLAGAGALVDGGSFTQILASSGDYAAALGARLRERVYVEAVPALATALARRQPEAELDDVYQQALLVLFRLLFVAYGEDKDLLPYRTNGRYQHQALKTMARDLAEHRIAERDAFDPNATDFWAQITALWDAVNRGNQDWGVPAYDGGLFSDDPNINHAGAALAQLELTNAEVGPALDALLVDIGTDDVIGPVDFRNLTVREFGTIYEGLLESSLSYAQTDLAVDVDGAYVPARRGDEVEVVEGEVYFHNRSGARKATGSYFTKPFAVEHLLDTALEPALDEHLLRLEELVQQGDEAAAAGAFFDFRCADIAMGSGHFLVAAVDRIEARLSAFLALHPIPAVTAELETLRAAALDHLGELADGVEIEQASLLRRQVARRCVYGVDRNQIAVELARLALWIHTFVPGLPLSFLDHTLQTGDSLTGVGTIEEAIDFLDPARGGQLSVFREQILGFLERARGHLRRLATIAETTTADIDAARKADREAREAVRPLLDAFDLIVSARLEGTPPPQELTEGAIANHPDLESAREWGEWLGALHFPVAFPEVFLRDPPGFDCIIGNPPWEEATVEKLAFWALRYPGLRGMSAAEQRREIARLEKERPDLVEEYEDALTEAENQRTLLLAGPYEGMGRGDPDLYKAFCWRFWHLMRDGGAIGVVLPRGALSASGSQAWREAVMDAGAFADVTLLLNQRQWVFEDVHPQYVVTLTGLRKGAAYAGTVRMRGPYASRNALRAGLEEKAFEVAASELQSWTATASFPLLPSTQAGDVFARLRAHPRLDTSDRSWKALPVAELHATNDKEHMELDRAGGGDLWPVYKGGSFDLWSPDTGEYYAWADPDHITDVLQERRLRQHRNKRSAFSHFPGEWVADVDTLPCKHPRLAFRDITNRLNRRTMISCLLPPEVVCTNKAPYLVFPRGERTDEAFVLGVLSSIPLDWYVRRIVERGMNFFLFNSLPIPNPEAEHPLRKRVIEIAGRLAARSARFTEWADAVGVPVGSVGQDDEPDLLAELDAAVALLYGLDPVDVRHIFETFHEGWDPTERLERVLGHYERLRDDA